MKYLGFYYRIKPFVPRRIQIGLRRILAARKRKTRAAVWPICPGAARPPEGWTGWPGGKKFALVLSHDVDTARGQIRCAPLMALEQELGFKSSFNFVPEGYAVSPALRARLAEAGFEIGVHGLKHDGLLFIRKKTFDAAAPRINQILKAWGSVGFNSPAMHHNLDWIADLDIEYDQSTFDTDPFEPQPDGLGTIFPLWVMNRAGTRGYVELPYTLPQDHNLFVILQERDIRIWKQKLDWIAAHGGLALLNTHPDYMNFGAGRPMPEEYPVKMFREFLEYVQGEYAGRYWNVLPRELARFWRETMAGKKTRPDPAAGRPAEPGRGKTVWIDLDNTPHVPFFLPIIRELEQRGCRVVLTARDAFQVCALAARNGLAYKKIGRHYGKNKILKVYGWILRAMKLAPFAIRQKPDLAVSHGSRSQVVLANLLGIPSVVLLDYEHSKTPPFTRPKWEIVPEIISPEQVAGRNVLTYSGIKEDVYVPEFTPDPAIRSELGLSDLDLVVTVRPPATEAHYHNPESETILSVLIPWILSKPETKIILLPRNEKQSLLLQKQYRTRLEEGRLIIPREAIPGLNLLYYSDLVVSGGGTMNREAAALGVPVYSIFRGPLGEVDRHLAAEGRLTMIAAAEEIPAKIKLEKRVIDGRFDAGRRPALRQIVEHIESIIGRETAPPAA